MTLMTNPEYKKKNQKVPAEIADFFKTSPAAEVRDQLIRDLCEKHWTYEAVATACGITRERVRQICLAEPTGIPAIIMFDIPTPPLKVEREKRVYVEPNPETLQGVLDALEAIAPGILQRVISDTGELRRFVNVYVNDDDGRFLVGLNTPTATGVTVSIVPAVAGG